MTKKTTTVVTSMDRFLNMVYSLQEDSNIYSLLSFDSDELHFVSDLFHCLVIFTGQHVAFRYV